MQCDYIKDIVFDIFLYELHLQILLKQAFYFIVSAIYTLFFLLKKVNRIKLAKLTIKLHNF